MITEIATITIDIAKADDFEAAVAKAQPFFEAATGFISFALERSIENPERYRLVVGWETIDAHMVEFRNSDGFGAWRELASPFFVGAPSVEHVERVI
jgi:heme-degrading monooxygenase HmoA